VNKIERIIELQCRELSSISVGSRKKYFFDLIHSCIKIEINRVQKKRKSNCGISASKRNQMLQINVKCT
jgi:hypothetical protein